MPKKILLILIFIVSLFSANHIFAQSIDDHQYRIFCINNPNIYVDLPQNTIKEKADATLQIINNSEILDFTSKDYTLSDIVNLSIKNKFGEDIKYTNNEFSIIFPLDKLDNFDKSKINNYAIFFYDNIKKQWISLNTVTDDKQITAKTSYIGMYAVFEKQYENFFDIFNFYAILTLGSLLIFGIIYYIYKLQNDL